jgi:Asp/Glu/hydantoin racemase
MRLLILNPNTSKGTTARIAEAAEAVRAPGDVFTTRCPDWGPELIVTEADTQQAAEAVVATVAGFEAPCDGIVLASFGNTGAAEVQALRPDIPVLGIATAAFAKAASLQRPFSIVTFGRALVPGLLGQVEEAGLTDRLVGTLALDLETFGEPGTVQARYRAELLELCRSAVRGGAECIVFGGGPLAGLAGRLAPECPVPLIDGTQAAIDMIRAQYAAARVNRPRPTLIF